MNSRGADLAGLTVLRYQEVIDGVVSRVKPSFNEEGIDESVLDEVRALWEAKLVATGVIGEPSNEGQQVIQQQLHYPRPVGVPGAVPGGLPMGMQQMQPGQHPAYLAMRPGMAPGMQGAMGMMVPPNMAAYAAMMQAQAQAQAQAAAAAEQKRRLEAAPAAAPAAKVQRTIPQQDGTPGEEDEQEDTKPEAAGGAAAGDAQQQEEEDDDPLTEDDEGSGDDVDEAAVTNVVLGQFEKVQRSKSKWKVVLKDCILTLNGRDYLVRRCTGEMDF